MVYLHAIFGNMESSAVFTQQFDIQSHHIGPDFEVSLQYLLGCMQTTADLHVDSHRLGWKDLHAKGCFWAIYRMGLRINRLPRKYDHITVRTWANPPQGIFQPRSFEVVDQQGDVYLYAQSLWIILDDKTFQPITIESVMDTDVVSLLGGDHSFPIPLKVPLAKGETVFPAVTRNVLYSDIDTNLHVNNTVYARWVLDSIPAEFLQSHRLSEMILNYVQQAHLGDTYDVAMTSMSEGRIATTISRHGGDGADFCKIVTRWEERKPEC